MTATDVAARKAAEVAAAMIATGVAAAMNAVMAADGAVAMVTAMMAGTVLLFWLPRLRVDDPPGVGLPSPRRHPVGADVERNE